MEFDGPNHVMTGMMGSGDGEIEFEGTLAQSGPGVFKYTFVESGDVKGIPFYQYIYAEETYDYPWEAVQVFDLNMNDMSFNWDCTGHVNHKNLHWQENFSIPEMAAGKKGFKAKLHMTGEFTQDEGFPVEMMMFQLVDYDITVTASMANECTVGPFANKCRVGFKVEGSIADEAFPEVELQWNVSNKNAKFNYNLGGAWQFKMKVIFGKYHVVNVKCLASGWTSWTHVLTVPGMDAMADIQEAGMEFIQPFMHILSSMFSDTDMFAHAAAYFDYGAEQFQGKSLFDCSEVVAATGFECPPLAGAIGWESMQGGLQGGCAWLNTEADAGMLVAGDGVKTARDYVTAVVSDAGEAKFNAWLSAIKF